MIIPRPRRGHDYGPEKEVHWLVLTGGPCSGKTTALSKIARELSLKGYKVYLVDEAATRIINSGISLEMTPGVTPVDLYDFQSYIAFNQVVSESTIEDAIQKTNHDRIVVICDRGLIDGAAYIDSERFNQILDELGTTEAEAKSSYDGVIHLVTAANGAEKYYNLSTNKARKETPEEARKLDESTLHAWMNHPRKKVIDNSTSFKKKMDRVMDAVYFLLGVPIPIDIYKKYLVEMPDLDKLQNEFNSSKVDIIRTYLLNKDNSNERSIIQRGSFGNFAFYYTEKRHFNGYDRIEVERMLSAKEYTTLISQADTRLKQISKTRYCFIWNNMYYELDVFPFWSDRAILKIQPTDKGPKMEIPQFLRVIEDITDNMSYTNYSLAQNIYS